MKKTILNLITIFTLITAQAYADEAEKVDNTKEEMAEDTQDSGSSTASGDNVQSKTGQVSNN
jgi:hypothetical protein